MPTLVGASLRNSLEDDAADLIPNLKLNHYHPYAATWHTTSDAFDILLHMGLYLVTLGCDVSNIIIQSNLELLYHRITEPGPSFVECCNMIGIATNSLS